MVNMTKVKIVLNFLMPGIYSYVSFFHVIRNLYYYRGIQPDE